MGTNTDTADGPRLTGDVDKQPLVAEDRSAISNAEQGGHTAGTESVTPTGERTMWNTAIATDASGRAVVVTHHRVEPGVNEHYGRYAVVRVDRTMCQNGDIAAVNRWVVSWWPDEMTARNERCRLDGYSQVS